MSAWTDAGSHTAGDCIDLFPHFLLSNIKVGARSSGLKFEVALQPFTRQSPLLFMHGKSLKVFNEKPAVELLQELQACEDTASLHPVTLSERLVFAESPWEQDPSSGVVVRVHSASTSMNNSQNSQKCGRRLLRLLGPVFTLVMIVGTTFHVVSTG